MKSKGIAAAILAASLLSSQATADEIKTSNADILDCFDQAYGQLQMPYGRTTINPAFTKLSYSKQLSEDFSMNVSLEISDTIQHRTKSASGPNRIVAIKSDFIYTTPEHNDAHYSFHKEISISFNASSISFSETGQWHTWQLNDPNRYASPDISSQPDFTAEQFDQINSWVKDSSNTMAYIFGLCMSNGSQEFEPKDGAYIALPSLPEIS